MTDREKGELRDAEWLDFEQGRWGIENRSHHTLDVAQREDESRVRQPNAAGVLGIFRRLSKVYKQVWAEGRAKREATSRDWTAENQFDRWKAIHLVTRRVAR